MAGDLQSPASGAAASWWMKESGPGSLVMAGELDPMATPGVLVFKRPTGP